jgi:capsular polysaccharide export protein
MGFEALLCGVDVTTFGVPFYAGYGLTTDLNQSERLTFRNKYIHSIEDIFYITYIRYTHYFETFSNNRYCKIEIEDCIEKLKNKVEKYKLLKGSMH